MGQMQFQLGCIIIWLSCFPLNYLKSTAQGGLLALYRTLLGSQWAQGLKSGISNRPGYVPTPSDLSQQQPEDEPEAVDVEPSDPRVCQQAALLALPATLVACVAKHYPRVLEMHPQVVIQRLLSLKEALPECDVSRLVEADPR